jgi:hypothetical protein
LAKNNEMVCLLGKIGHERRIIKNGASDPKATAGARRHPSNLELTDERGRPNILTQHFPLNPTVRTRKLEVLLCSNVVDPDPIPLNISLQPRRPA